MVEFIHGAEAIIQKTELLGRPLLQKSRAVKPYRHPELDARLRDERTRDEANLLAAARAVGVPTPVVHDIDRGAGSILMEQIDGKALRDVLPKDDVASASARLQKLGQLTARMHDGGITHGDLTTSNVLIPNSESPESMVIIDFGLGQFTMDGEQRAVDLHLVEEALEATDERAHELMEAFLAGYQQYASDSSDALRRLEGVRDRGRYRGAS